jgi:GxxExxY protein
VDTTVSTPAEELTENEIARVIIDAAFHIHTTLEPGLLESVYEAVLSHELRKRGLTVVRQQPVSIEYDGLRLEEGFRADLIVNGKVIVELKSVELIHNAHKKQLLTYLRLTGLRLGILLNFGACRLKEGITRIANGLYD